MKRGTIISWAIVGMMTFIGGIVAYGDGIGGSAEIEEWEHGFKTQHIIATRYKNLMIGYNIGFRYLQPRYDNKADSENVLVFFEKHGCNIFQGGGAPFSEYFVQCKGVTDRESANAKLKTLLPALDKFITTL